MKLFNCMNGQNDFSIIPNCIFFPVVYTFLHGFIASSFTVSMWQISKIFS